MLSCIACVSQSLVALQARAHELEALHNVPAAKRAAGRRRAAIKQLYARHDPGKLECETRY